MIRAIALFSTFLGAIAQQTNGSVSSGNGNVAFSLTKDYIESYQGLFKKNMIREIEDLKLRDVRVQQKTDMGRLTTIMKDVSLYDIELADAIFSIDFIDTHESDLDQECVENFDLRLNIKGF